MPFTIERNDLARMDVDAVVVAANEDLRITGGVGGSVARAAGLADMQAACDAIGGCPTGSAVATPGFALSARHVIHVVGPVWQDGEHGEEELLARAYDSALALAAELGAHSVALPLVSAGTYGVPVRLSFTLALAAVKRFLEENDLDVRLVLYGREALEAGSELYDDIAEYIDDHYVEQHTARASADRRRREPGAWGRATQRVSVSPTGQVQVQPAPASPQAGSKPARRTPFGKLAEAVESLRERIADGASEPSRQEAPRVREDALPPEREAGEDLAGSYGSPSAPAYQDFEDELELAAAPFVSGAPAAPAHEGFEEHHELALEPPAPSGAVEPGQSLESWLDRLDASFSTTLLALIDERGLTDAQVYKRANMSRQLFSKIRSDVAYRPTKKTVLALSVALGLTLPETHDLLRRAGFALSHSSKSDVIVEYFIVNGKYDIFAINEALYAFDQPLL